VAANSLGKSIYEGACVSCHGWSGESPVSPYATLTGARAVNDPKAVNVAQVVISGTKRTAPAGITQMPGFGDAYSNAEIAAVANFVTARFGAASSSLNEHDIEKLRQQAAQ
jgi:mono/diheme cytochrome c family protein